MIDIHCHILPDLDDGAKDWQETLDMCAIARNDGIHTIVATPHIKPGVYSSGKALILSKVAELNTLLTSHSSPPSSNVKSKTLEATPYDSQFTLHELAILPGADNVFEPDILSRLEQGTAVYLASPMNPINPKNQTNQTTKPTFRYVLLELSDYFLFPQVKDLIRKLREKNIVPVLSHPERIAMIQRNHKLLHEFIQAGALSQVTAMSITGEFGKEIKKLTRTLIKKNLAQVIATDAHSRDLRPPILSRAVSEVADLIGSEKAELMVQGIPQAIIDGKEVDIT
jgi:Capsular polysaccharide biosynthesis protein